MSSSSKYTDYQKQVFHRIFRSQIIEEMKHHSPSRARGSDNCVIMLQDENKPTKLCRSCKKMFTGDSLDFACSDMCYSLLEKMYGYGVSERDKGFMQV
jgi:hypothetical protein